MKKIDFEAHFITEKWVEALYQNKECPRFIEDKGKKTRRLYFSEEASEPFGDVLFNNLLDVGEGRLKKMDKAAINVQVLSLTAPGVEYFNPAQGLPLAAHANNTLAEIISSHPDRFAGFAALAPKDIEGSCKELERCVKELGFIGWKTHSNFGDSYLDEKRYWPLLSKAEELDIPIYLHPTSPMIPQLRTYGFALAGAPFGFGIETSTVTMRLILSGALDQFPNLKIMLGHLGEGLPFVLQRIDFPFVRPHFKADPGTLPNISKTPGTYIKENIYVTTSGNYLKPAFICTRDALGIDRILLSTDYPYEDSGECMEFLEGLPISQEEKDKIYSLNAETLFGRSF